MYIGEFKDDLESGKGVYTDGDVRIIGEWRHGYGCNGGIFPFVVAPNRPLSVRVWGPVFMRRLCGGWWWFRDVLEQKALAVQTDTGMPILDGRKVRRRTHVCMYDH